MSRNIVAIVGILFCSASVIGQDFVIPKNNTAPRPETSGFQPPTSSFRPISREAPIPEPISQKQDKIVPPSPEIEQTGRLAPQPDINKANTTQATIQPMPTIEKQDEEPAIILPKKDPQPSIQLPTPKPEIEIVDLKEDKQTYKSSPFNNTSGVSEYRLAVAREKARARRMRMEVKKWYGIDSARPVVAPRVDLPTYSAYYNGVYSSRTGYFGGYGYNGPNFYYHFPVGR